MCNVGSVRPVDRLRRFKWRRHAAECEGIAHKELPSIRDHYVGTVTEAAGRIFTLVGNILRNLSDGRLTAVVD